MDLPFRDNPEARLMYFVYRDDKWTCSILDLSEICFHPTPPRIRKRPVTSHESTSSTETTIGLILHSCYQRFASTQRLGNRPRVYFIYRDDKWTRSTVELWKSLLSTPSRIRKQPVAGHESPRGKAPLLLLLLSGGTRNQNWNMGAWKIHPY